MDDIPPRDEPTIVEVQNIDCLYAGVQLKEQGYKNAKEIFLGICSEDNQLALYPA